MVNLSNGPPPIVHIFFQDHPNHKKLLEICLSTINCSLYIVDSFIVDTCYRGCKFRMTNYVHNKQKMKIELSGSVVSQIYSKTLPTISFGDNP